MGCVGISNGGAEAIYHENNTSPFTFIAYSLDRDLEPTEQLDFSGPGCAPFIATAPNAQKKGCYTLETDASCWRLWIMVALDGPVTERPADIASGYSRAPCLAGECGFYVV